MQKRRLKPSEENAADKGQTRSCSEAPDALCFWCKRVSCRRDVTRWKAQVWHLGHTKHEQLCATRIVGLPSQETHFHRSSQTINQWRVLHWMPRDSRPI